MLGGLKYMQTTDLQGILDAAMEIPLAVVADAANTSVEGKLNIFGIFNRITAASFPAVHPQMLLVIVLQADSSESGQEKSVEVQLVDSDGQKLFLLRGNITVPRGKSGYPIIINHLFHLAQVKFPKPGDYEFKILINEDPKRSISFLVNGDKDKQ